MTIVILTGPAAIGSLGLAFGVTVTTVIAELKRTFEITHRGLLIQEEPVEAIDEGDVTHEKIPGHPQVGRGEQPLR